MMSTLLSIHLFPPFHCMWLVFFFFFSSRRRHTRWPRDWSSDVCSSDLPFTYRGVILEPVLGWTNHHSVVEVEGKWYLFYHDCELSEGVTHLRNMKMTEL